MIDILKDLGIPLRAAERSASDPLIFGGGPVLTANPEPWAEFFDFIAIGDAEGNVDAIIDTCVSLRGTRDEAISRLKDIPGIYVPSLEDDYTKIARQKSDASELAISSVIAPDACWGDTGLIEVVRSCPEMCKFCLASFGALPFRAPKLEQDLIPKAEEILKYTRNIGLLGASVTQHSKFMEFLEWLHGSHPDVQLQLASVRASTVTPKMCELLAAHGVKNLTIAIESGSERLRDHINKKLPEKYIFDAARAAGSSGLKSLKLYGMVGLPSETDEDIELTINLLRRLKEENKGLKIIWGCSVFTPKMLTPFYKYGVDKNAEKKLKHMEKSLAKLGIETRAESYKWAQVQALISRGDRSINDLMIRVKETGNTGFSPYKKLLTKDEYEHFVFANW